MRPDGRGSAVSKRRVVWTLVYSALALLLVFEAAVFDAAAVALLSGVAAPNPPPAAPTRVTDDAADLSLCKVVAGAMRDSYVHADAFLLVGDTVSAARDDALPPFQADVTRDSTRLQPMLDAHPPTQLNSILQNYVDAYRLYAANLAPGDLNIPAALRGGDSPDIVNMLARDQQGAEFFAAQARCNQMGVTWWAR